jgi:hypothetical protein
LNSNLPGFLQEGAYRFSLKFLPSLLDPLDSAAFDLPKETTFLTSMFRNAMSVRAFILKHLFLPRAGWVTRSPFYANEKGFFVPEFNTYAPVYPDGYKIEELGPKRYFPKDAIPAQCPVKHKK